MKKVLFFALLFASISSFGQDPPISSYFEDMCLRHLGKFVARDSAREFVATCSRFDLDNASPENIKNYYKLEIMHELFSTTGATDGNSGFILKMPYFWHYIQPNPRAEILVDGRVNISYATIERMPHFFLGDMVAPAERFTHPVWGTFSSFGWCSEREMAFACLLSLMGYKSHVIAPGNHAKTEIEVPFRTVKGDVVTVLVSVDNTFYGITWSLDAPSDHNNIYDKRGLATAEVNRVRGLTVSPAARARIETAVNKFLKEN